MNLNNVLFDTGYCVDVIRPVLNSCLGVTCLSVILLCCLYNIYSKWVDDTIADRLYYWSMAITSIAGIFQAFSKGNSVLIFQSYLVLMSLRCVQKIIEKVIIKRFRLPSEK